ncbi:MAG: SpoVA/SpoVAEb family sporulation membrane protein [Clostridia bacterium]|nr:SpoVA/SpoVAEb family sporulation membrane protein [Clostridia bacterium]
MNMEKETYKRLADAHAPRSPIGKNCLFAFLFGGGICTLAQGIREVWMSLGGMGEEDAGTLTCVTLILAAVVLTGLGWFDRIAKIAGAGTLVPITGFANAVVSPAIDSHAEGLILGVGAKIFTVAGPVLLYGTLAGSIYGVIYFLFSLF